MRDRLIQPSKWSVWVEGQQWCADVGNDILFPGRIAAAARLFGVKGAGAAYNIIGIGTSDAPSTRLTQDLLEPLRLSATLFVRSTGTVVQAPGSSRIVITAVIDATTQLAPSLLSVGASHTKQLREAVLFASLTGGAGLYRVIFPTALPISGNNSLTIACAVDV